MNELSAAPAKPSEPSSAGAVERPIDLVHLARTTFGERALEREVLQLFERQAATLMERIQAAPAEDIPALAHTLKGSARAIGAVAVARAAETVEFMHSLPSRYSAAPSRSCAHAPRKPAPSSPTCCGPIEGKTGDGPPRRMIPGICAAQHEPL